MSPPSLLINNCHRLFQTERAAALRRTLGGCAKLPPPPPPLQINQGFGASRPARKQIIQPHAAVRFHTEFIRSRSTLLMRRNIPARNNLPRKSRKFENFTPRAQACCGVGRNVIAFFISSLVSLFVLLGVFDVI